MSILFPLFPGRTFPLRKWSDHVTADDMADVITWKVMLVCAPFLVPPPNLKVSGFGCQVLGKTNTKLKPLFWILTLGS